MQCQKTFFLCLLYIYTFPIASFHFFCELNDLGSKLGLQRAQFWSWLPEQQNPRNLRAWYKLRCTRPPQSQSGALFCHLNHHCVVLKSARYLWKQIADTYKTSQELRNAALRVVGCQGVEVWQNSKTQIVKKNLTRATVAIVTITTVTNFTTVTVTTVTVTTVNVTTVTITTVTIK